MTDKVQIVNNALSLIGTDSITSLDEKTVTARRVKTIYDVSRQALLRLHPFQCAIKRISLAPLALAPEFGFTYQYQLPDDLIRLIDTNLVDYVIEAGRLLTNTNQLELIYVFNNTNEETFDSLFVECLVLYLAYKLAKPITGSQGTSDSYYRQCQELIKQSKVIQSQEQPSQIFGNDEDFLLTSRY